MKSAPPATSPSCGQQPLHRPGGPRRSSNFAAPDSSAPTRQGIKTASAPAEKSGERARRRAPLSQLLRSGRGEADPVPESGAATAPNRKSLKWNRRRRRRRPHHRAASSRCAAQAARAGRADSAPPKASFAAPDSSAPTRQGIKSASAPAEKSGERARRRAPELHRRPQPDSLNRKSRRRRRRPHHRAACSRCTAQAAQPDRAGQSAGAASRARVTTASMVNGATPGRAVAIGLLAKPTA